MRHEIRIELSPPTRREAELLMRRTGSIPDSHSGIDLAAFIPTRRRRWHHAYAVSRGYFWLKCPLCAQPFGGHECCDSIPDPTSPSGYGGVMICADCSERRVTAAAAGWTGPTCPMCHGSGVYPYRPPDGIRWGRCGACNGHGREPQ